MHKNDLKHFADLESIWVQGIIEIAQKLDFEYVVWEEVFTNGVKVRFFLKLETKFSKKYKA